MTRIGTPRGPLRQHRGRGRPPQPSRWNQPDALLFDAAAVIAVFLVPFVVGGRHPAGYAAISMAAIVACLAWLVRMLRVDEPFWTLGPGEAFLTVALLIGGIQLVWLPKSVIDVASPRLHDLLPAYSGGAWSLGTWQTFSLTPGETAVGLSILLAQGILALVVYQFAHSIKSVERVLVIVVAAAVMLALHGLVQFVGHEGKNFDVAAVSFHEEGGLVKALFRNRNDFAGFLAIAAGPAVWLAFWRRETPLRGGQSRRGGLPPQGGAEVDGMRVAIGLGILAIVSFAVFASLARGGSIALGVAIVLGCGMLVRSGHLRPRMGLAIFAMAALVAVALEIHGMEQVTARAESLFEENLRERAFGRREVWSAAWQTILAYPLMGTGIGSHGDVSRITMPPTGSNHFVHAENSYLNLAVEAGFPGLSLAVAALAVALIAAVTVFLKGTAREKAVATAITAALTAGAVNAIGHFNWYVPAITTLMIVLGSCAVRMAARHAAWIPSVTIPVPRSMAAVLATATVMLLGTIVSRQITAATVEPTWDKAVTQSRTLARDRRAALAAEVEVVLEAAEATRAAEEAAAQKDEGDDRGPTRRPLEPTANLVEQVNAVLAQRAAVLAGLDERLALLEAVATARPDHPRAWAEIATARCERFGLARQIAGESMRLVDLRRVAMEREFDSRGLLSQWLRRVVGDSLDDLLRAYSAAKRAVIMAPCSGDAWCVLANLAFLESFDAELPRRCISQALIVRPHDGNVLFMAAEQAALDGDAELATARWRECFAVSLEHREVILALVRTKLSAERAVALLDPDLAGLRAIDTAWSRQSSSDEMRSVRELRLAAVHAAATEAFSPQLASRRCSLLCEAASLHRALGQHVQAADALTAAIAANPAHYAARMARVDLALMLDDPDAAKQHLDWLLLRRPDADAVQTRLNRLAQLRVRLASVPAAATTPPHTPPTPSGARP